MQFNQTVVNNASLVIRDQSHQCMLPELGHGTGYFGSLFCVFFFFFFLLAISIGIDL